MVQTKKRQNDGLRSTGLSKGKRLKNLLEAHSLYEGQSRGNVLYVVEERSQVSDANDSSALGHSCVATDRLWCFLFRSISLCRRRWEARFPMCSKNTVVSVCALRWRGVCCSTQSTRAGPAGSSSLWPIGFLAEAVLSFIWRVWFLIMCLKCWDI